MNVRIVWRPRNRALLPLELEPFPPELAARQVARYSFERYVPVRKKLEHTVAALSAGHKRPRRNDAFPDSFIAEMVTLRIDEAWPPRDETPEYRLLLDTHPSAEDVGTRRSAPDSREVDVTEMTAWESSP